jgi:eukaryotic-like serine/threonine-protein kinase
VADNVERLRAALAARYALERELGSGGMATVYLAEDSKHHRKVAVKVLRAELAAAIGSERFFREIDVAARLQHPHILPLLDSGTLDEGSNYPGGRPYYVMPFIEGESLRDRLGRGELPVDEAVKILVEVVDALSYAHGHGVVHRDIKPDNVLLSGRHALVMDFGVAKAVSDAAGNNRITETGVSLGTPAYMAPEQAVADPNIDHRVDIYAVGALAYELLTGRPPFQGTTAQEVLVAHVTHAAEPVTKHRPAVPPALGDIIMKCLEKRPADRWQSAEALLSQLEAQAMTSRAITPLPSAPPRAVGSGQRAVRTWLGVIVGAAVVAGGIVTLWLRSRQPEALVLGKRAAVAVTPEWEIHPSLSPDGKLLAYTSMGNAPARILVQQIDGGNAVVVTPSGFGGTFSPDGTKLLILTSRGLETMPVLGGQSRVVANTTKWGDWSPDGRAIVYPRGDTLFVQAIDSVRATAIATGWDLHSPAWSTDGRWIAYVEGNSIFHRNGNIGASGIRIVSARGGGSPVWITPVRGLNTSPVWEPGRFSLLFISDREGGRDIYQVAITPRGTPRGDPVRLTTGLDAERITISSDGRRLAWSQFRETANAWSIPIPTRDSIPFSRATQVTTGTQSVEGVAISLDNEWLYYDSNRAGNSDIYRQRLSDGSTEQLTNDPAADFSPAVSPDGRTLAFHSLRTGNRDIFLMPASGGEALQITRNPEQDYNPSWSPDGRQFVFDQQRNVEHGLWLTERTASGEWSTPEPFPAVGRAARPRWSPDGRWISFVAPEGVSVVEVGSNQPARLLYAWRDDVYPGSWTAWSTDSRTIFLARSDSLGLFRIVAIPLDGRRVTTVAYPDIPARQFHRHGIAASRDRLFFPLIERNSDVWVAEIERR